MKIWKLTPVFFVLLSVQLTWALGVTQPVPLGLELMRGESSDFSFEIQAVTSSSDVSCTYNMKGMEGLIVTFDQDETFIEAGSYKRVHGTVAVPENADTGKYSGELSVSCGPSVAEAGGSKIKTTISGSPFSVTVVSAREEELQDIREEEVEEMGPESMILIVVAVIVLIGVYYLLEKGKSSTSKQDEKKKGTKKRKKKTSKKSK